MLTGEVVVRTRIIERLELETHARVSEDFAHRGTYVLDDSVALCDAPIPRHQDMNFGVLLAPRRTRPKSVQLYPVGLETR